jgi:hypothetical protein
MEESIRINLSTEITANLQIVVESVCQNWISLWNHNPYFDEQDAAFLEFWRNSIQQKSIEVMELTKSVFLCESFKRGNLIVPISKVDEFLQGITSLRLSIQKSKFQDRIDEIELENGEVDLSSLTDEISTFYWAYSILAQIQEYIINIIEGES